MTRSDWCGHPNYVAGCADCIQFAKEVYAWRLAWWEGARAGFVVASLVAVLVIALLGVSGNVA